MVLTPVVSLAATEILTLQRANCGAVCGRKEGVGREIGIVEGWGSDEDEDVDIESDEKDSGSEGLLQAEDNSQVHCTPTADFRLQLSNSSSMLQRTESLPGLSRNEDHAGGNERPMSLKEVACPIRASEDNELGAHAGNEQVGIAEGGIVENGKIATAHRGVRLGSSSEGRALEGGTKRLDARRFRRDFNVKPDDIPARMKITAPDAGLVRESIRSNAKDGNKLLEEKDVAGRKASKFSPTQPYVRTTIQMAGGQTARDNYGKGKRTFREEISKQGKSVLQRSAKVRMTSDAEQFNKDTSKKRRLNDLDYAQAVERKSSLRIRRELSNPSEGKTRRESRSYGDAGSFAKSKRVRKDEVSEVGTSVSEKQIPPNRGLEKAIKSPGHSAAKAERQKLAVDNKNQRPPLVKGYCRKLSAKGEEPRHCLSGGGTKNSDSGVAKETFELDNWEKVFERRPTRRKETRNGSGDNLESKRPSRLSAVALDLSDGSGGVFRTFGEQTAEKELGKPLDRIPTRSSEKAQEDDCGGVQHLFSNRFSGIELAAAGEIEMFQAEKLYGKRNQSSEADMESNRTISSGVIQQEANFEVKEGIEREGLDMERKAKSAKQSSTLEKVNSLPSWQEHKTRASLRQTDNIWHPKAFLSQCVAIADIDPKISADLPAKEALPRQFCGGNDKILEEGEIGSSDSDGKQEVDKTSTQPSGFTLPGTSKNPTFCLVGEPVLPREAKEKTRLGACEIDVIHEDNKRVTMPAVQYNEQMILKIRLGCGESQAAVEEVDSMERICVSKRGYDGKLKALHTLDIDAHVSPHASTIAGGEKSQPVAVAGGEYREQVCTLTESARRENDGNESVSVQAEVDELGVPEGCPTVSHESIVGELHSPPVDKSESFETSELEAGYDLREDISDSEDGRLSDHHNSYCQYCRQGGELLCCDGGGCKITYHLECTDPRLWEVPSGNWYCPKCAHKRLSYGVHAVSKSVESIWDVRTRAQSSDPSTFWSKDITVNDLHGFCDKLPWKRGRSLEGARGMHVKSWNGLEDECMDAMTMYFYDEEEIPGIAESTSGPQRANRRKDEDKRLAEMMTDTSKMVERKTILGSTSNVIQGLKLDDEFGDKEYFVKWRGISHAHNTWVGEVDLAKLSPKGLTRFKRKLAEGQVVQWSSDWAEPQRLVEKRVSIPPRRPDGGKGRGVLGMDSEQEWFVKWKGLGYEHCTWEPVNKGVLSHPKAEQLELMFERWSEAARQRNAVQRVDESDKLREASFKQLQSQPEWIGFGKVLPYQLDRLNQLRQRWHHRQNTVIVDQNEQEKTSTTVTFLLSLIEEYRIYRLILVVVPVFEIQCWEAEITENAPQVNTVVYTGGKEARGVIQRFELNRTGSPLRVQVVLTTCDVAFSDFDYLSKIKWEVVVVDESQQFKTAKSHRAFLQFDAGFWLLYISELSKYNVEELQQILFLFQPQRSSSTSDVCMQFSGLNESDQFKYLKDQLSRHIVRESRQDDASGLKLVESWVGTNMTSLQIQLYCHTLTKHYNLLQSGRLRSDPDSPSLHDFVTQLRLGCGKEDLPASQSLIDAGVAASEKWQLIHAMLSILHVQHQRVVILSQSLMLLFFLDDYLRQKYGPDSYELVDTRYSASRKVSAVQRFNAKDSTRSFFLLRTGAFGFNLKLKDKDIIIIHDSDLNPANDLEYLRKVLHRVDGEVKVCRLYQHLTIEEGSMVYAQNKKFAPDPKPLSVKILQQLLRWNVKHILELDSSSSGKMKIPKGKHKADVKATQDLGLVANILQGNSLLDSTIADHVDEGWAENDGDSAKEFWFSLLKDRHAELQDRNEQLNPGKGLRQRKRVQYSEEALALAPYSVLEEEDIRRKRRKHQLVESTSVSVTRDKVIHSSLQSHASTPRQARSCQDEEAILDNALYSNPVSEVGRIATSEPEISLVAPVMDLTAREQCFDPVGSDGVCEQHTLEVVQKPSKKAVISSVAISVEKERRMRNAPPWVVLVSKHQNPAAAGNVSLTNSQVDNGKRLRMEQKQLLLRMEPELSRIGDILQVAVNEKQSILEIPNVGSQSMRILVNIGEATYEALGPDSPLIRKKQGTGYASLPQESIARYSRQLLSHVMNNFRMPKEPRELVVMVEISLCLIASARFRQVVQHLPAISLVGEKMNLAFKNEEFASVYSRLESMCKTCVVHSPALQGATGEGMLNDAVQVNLSSQLASTGNEQPVPMPPTYQVSKPFTNCNLRPSSGKQACNDPNHSLQSSVLLFGKAEMALMAKDDLLRIEDEQSDQPTEAGDCKGTGFQDSDPSLQARSDQDGTHNPEVILGPGSLRKQPMAASSEKIRPLLWPVGAIRARLKSDRDQLLHSWLAKQKLEVQEFNMSCAQQRDAWEKSFEKQKANIVATSVKIEQTREILRDLGDLYASTLKLCEREEEDRRQVMNSTQRDLRDRINALYTALLQQVTTGTLPDLVSEARSMGLTFAMQFETPELLEHGPRHTKHGQQIAVLQVQPSTKHSLLDQNTDLGSLPCTFRARVRPHSPHRTQPQSQEATPPPTPNPQTLFPSQSLLQHEAHVLPQMQLHCRPHLQHVDLLRSSLVTTFPQTFRQDMASNPNHQLVERSHLSSSHLNILESSSSSVGSEVIAMSGQGLECTPFQVEQGSVLPPMTHSRVSELINTAATQESIVAQTSQTAKIPTNPQPSVSQIVHAATSLQGRISPSVQASPNLQLRGSQTVITGPPQGPQTVDAPTGLQPRVSQIPIPLSNHLAPRHPPSLYYASASQVRVQSQLQPTSGHGNSFRSASSTVGGTLLAIQTRSNVHPQNVPLGTHSLQSAFGPDPLAHEENRLKRLQEKLKLLYNEENTQIKTEYEREATELRRKYEGLLFERAQIFEQKTTALKENLDKVDRNRQLAEALKLRSFFDQQKAGQSTAVIGRLSGATAHISGPGHVYASHQTNVIRNVGWSIGRGFAGAVANARSAGPDVGDPNNTSDMGNVGSHIASWQSSRSSNCQNVPPAGLISGAPLSSALPDCVPQCPWSFSSTGFVTLPESFPQTNSSVSSGPFSVSFERVLFKPESTTGSSLRQEGQLVFLHDESENLMVRGSRANVEHMSSNRGNSDLLPILSIPTAPAISISTALTSPTVTEAVVVSVSAVSSPLREQLINTELAGNMPIQEHNYLGIGPLSVNEVSDLFVPLSENQIVSTFETRVRSGALLEAELEGLCALTEGQKGLASSSTVGLKSNSCTPVPVICLSDDD